jgi:hypothetical protein
MAKKSRGKTKREAKSSRSGKVGKDPVTGLSFEIDGVRIVSDEVVGKDSALGRLVTAGDPYASEIQSMNLEIELGKSFIVFTIQEVRTPSVAPAYSSIARGVLQGDFRYKGSRMTSARVDYFATVSENGDYGYGDVTYTGGVVIPNPSSLSSWSSALSNPGSQIASFDRGSESPGVITGNYAGVASFAQGRFFQEGWTSNLFASNLV